MEYPKKKQKEEKQISMYLLSSSPQTCTELWNRTLQPLLTSTPHCELLSIKQEGTQCQFIVRTSRNHPPPSQ